MNNFLFCLFLYTYGSLMAIWFFQKHKIQKSLPLALVTHNPVQMIMNIYIISFTVIKYDIAPFSLTNVLAAFTLYFPALIWEITRKIRAPQDETEYVTYSKLFGYRKSTDFALVVTLIDIVTNFILVWNLNKISVVLLAANVGWMTFKFQQFKKDPTRFKLVSVVEQYTYIQECIMILTIVVYLIFGKI
jgi:4-hydroxybenzoate polyprenyltransferase